MIPVCEPFLGRRELELVGDCVAKGWVSASGPQVAQFERAWANYCGARHAIAVSSGTAALQVAVDALDLGPGDEVVMPSFTIISCALAVIRAGATPVVVDCDPRTFCVDPELVAKAVTPRTRAIMPVHMYGHPVDMDPIRELAGKRSLAIIEDAAQAHGSEYLSCREPDRGWQRCGALGTMGVFSFFANKLVTTGEGGMVLTDSDELAERCRCLRNLAFHEERFNHKALGYNFRLTSVQSAIGLAQIERMSSTLATKHRIAAAYRELLSGTEPIFLPEQRDWARSNHWMNAIVLADDAGLDAFELARRLAGMGIETRPFFKGMHEQPVLKSRGLFERLHLPVTERLYRRGLYLPSGVSLTDGQIEAVAAGVKAAVAA